MNYAQVEKLVNAIDAVGTWSRAIEKELNKSAEDFDSERYSKLQDWLANAKQEIFELVAKEQQ